jgi:hypothetical protein
MISVSIFALRDVIRQVQLDYKVSYNSTSHTSPSTDADIKELRRYLQLQQLQAYNAQRENNTFTTPVRDLMETGAAYANTARAFKTFRADNRKAENHGTTNGPSTHKNHGPGDEIADPDFDKDLDLDIGDLALDDEEFPAGTNPADIVAMAQEVIDELSRYY